MKKRKGMSKKKRFDIFKRDGFQCAYCGKGPPLAVLEVDHILPVSVGGKNTDDNLITACFDCNRGKRDGLLNIKPTLFSENIKLIKEKESQLLEYRKFCNKIIRRENKDISDIENIFKDEFPKEKLTNNFKKSSLKKFLSLLPKHEIEEAMAKAVSFKNDDPDSAVKYFCGICWNKIRSNKK